MNIRLYHQDDLEAVRYILWETWKESYASFIPVDDLLVYFNANFTSKKLQEQYSDTRAQGFIVEYDDVVAGYEKTFYDEKENRLYVHQLYILPVYQNLGLGRKLLQSAAERAQSMGLDKIWIGVMIKNEPAVVWYKKMGYEIVENAPFTMGTTTVDHFIGFIPVGKILAGGKYEEERATLANTDRKILKVFSPHHPVNRNSSLSELCSELFAQQQSVWHQMAGAYASLEYVRIREIICSGFTVKVQFNPNRMASTGADIDPAAIRMRPCFLCLENLPEVQQGIQYRDDYLVLCNPVPIFPRHFTVSFMRHTPQEFGSSIDAMLDIARDIHSEYSVFYNGPECGASAPDHLHFQVSPRRAIPVEWDAVDARRRKRFYYKNHVAGFTLMNYGRAVMVIESSDKSRLQAFIQSLLVEWRNLLHLTREPMINVLCSYQENIWRIIIFPRRKHRPDAYFKEGKERVLISPAFVDMGGLIVTPWEKDFLKADAKLIEDIYSEVSEKQEIVDALLEKLV